MASKFVKVSEKDLAKGIDARSSQDNIQPGYSEDLQNVDTNSNGTLNKRTGFEGYYGGIPVRVSKVERSTALSSTFRVYFESSVNINTAFLPSSPVVMQGRVSSTADTYGDWAYSSGDPDANAVKWYPGFTTDAPATWSTGANTWAVAANELTAKTAMIGTLEATGVAGSNDNQQIFADVTRINNTTFDVEHDTVLASSESVFLFAEDKATVAAASYAAQFGTSHSTTENTTIAQATHGLTNLNIIAQVFEEDAVAGEDELVWPDSLTIDTSSSVGDITISITNSGSAKQYRVVMTSAPAANSFVQSISPGEQTVVVSNITNAFHYYAVYSSSSGTLTQVIPDNVVYDESEQTLTFHINNSASTNETFVGYWETDTVNTNSIVLTDSNGTATDGGSNAEWTDTDPQLTLWGFPHSELYTSTSNQEGHVTHIDSYKRAAETRLIAGLGGNLYSARTQAEAGTNYALPSTTVDIQGSMGADTNIAPAFGRTVSFADTDIIAAATFTATSIDDTCAATAHGLSAQSPVDVSTTTTLPGGLFASTTYYAIVVDDDSFKLASTAALALAKTPINLTSAGSGTHTFTPNGLNITGHDYETNDPVLFTEASGTLPTNLNTTNTFYAIKVTNNIVQVSASLNGTALAVTGAVAGTYGMKVAYARNTTGPALSSDVARDGTTLVTAATYVSEDSVTYTLSLSSNTVDVSGTITTTSPVGDRLTISGMAKPANNGTFVVTAVGGTDTAPTFTVTNTSAKLAGLITETSAKGRGGIFTDTVAIDTAANNDFIPGDTIVSALFSDVTSSVVSTSGTSVLLNGITKQITLTTAYKLYVTRTTDVLPMLGTHTNSDILSAGEGVEGFVRHDMLTVVNLNDVTTLNRNPRITFINSDGDNTITASNVATSGSVTLTVSTHTLRVGQQVILLRTGVPAYDGPQTITAVPSTTSITFASTTTTGTSTGVIQGNTIEIDESLAITDGTTPTTITTTGRWIPIESPDSDDTLVDITTIKHMDSKNYNTQDVLRSTVVSDNMYFTNNNDEVLKFDGTNLYQAGLFRWQPGLFASVSTSGSITAGSLTATVATVSGSSVTLTPIGEASLFTVGERVTHSQDSASYTIASIDTVTGIVGLDATVSGSNSGELFRIDQYRYYFRLNALDANQNIIASATTGADDFVVELSVASNINLRLVGFPAWGNYDYDRLELQVYRTRKNTSGPFYLKDNVDISFNQGAGYIDILDNTNDALLAPAGTATNDPTVLGITGGTALGNAWTGPLRGKYITSINNRLVLGNCKDYPELDMTLFQKPGTGAVPSTDLEGLIVKFDKDNTDSGTTSNMIDRAYYEFETSNTTTPNTITPGSNIATTATNFTVTDGNSLAAGDWIYMYHAAAGADNDLTFAGWWQIASVAGGTSFVVDFSEHGRTTSGGTANDVDTWIEASTANTNIPVWLGTDGNYNQLGFSTSEDEGSHMIRLAHAINSSMRMTDTTLASPDMSTFVPWLSANAGSEYNNGQIVIRQDKVISTATSMTTPADPTNGKWFVNGLAQAATEVTASTRLFTSRILVSYENYPELFDNPWGDPSLSTSAIDVNSADGQQITGIIPFFGDSAYESAQVGSVLVVFKTHSIYLVDVNSRRIQKIQSNGQGCTAPFSISQSKNRIMFANESGIYALGQDQKVEYVGRFIERLWQDSVDKDNIAKATGHHYDYGRKYKISVPVGTTQTTNNRVYVYDYTREIPGQSHGAWTQYTNHDTVGWANQDDDAFFASYDGNVFRVRKTGDTSDYRDDGSAVADMVILTRANDFGQSALRKIIGNVSSHFQLRRGDMNGTSMSSSADLSGVFEASGAFSMTKDSTIKVDQAVSSIASRRMVYLQLKYENSTKDEDVILSGIDVNVAGLSIRGIPQQNDD